MLVIISNDNVSAVVWNGSALFFLNLVMKLLKYGAIETIMAPIKLPVRNAFIK